MQRRQAAAHPAKGHVSDDPPASVMQGGIARQLLIAKDGACPVGGQFDEVVFLSLSHEGAGRSPVRKRAGVALELTLLSHREVRILRFLVKLVADLVLVVRMPRG